MKEHVKVPMDRVGVVIGSGGETLQLMEDLTGVSVSVDSENGLVSIDRSDADPLLGWRVREVVKAIGRGFTPEKALELVDEDRVLEIVRITRYDDSPKGMRRLRGRVIGRDGKTRNLIEEITGTHLAVKGKTVAIVGEAGPVAAASEAVRDLLGGAPHGAVYRSLESWRREEKRRRLLSE
ncbi:MAG: Polyribonucleotide nucleotidyltransferase [Methanonatronarchaeales archaeon]|nr:Polyribonucleotide nucleotidyltransferase [Methanonatronarchaeales archaeon]